MEDISILLGDELVLENNDVVLNSDVKELLQNIKIESITTEGDVFYDLEFGWSLYEFIHSPIDDMLKLELYQRIKSKLSKYKEINKDTIKIEFVEKSNSLLIKIKFYILDIEEDLTIDFSRISIVVN